MFEQLSHDDPLGQLIDDAPRGQVPLPRRSPSALDRTVEHERLSRRRRFALAGGEALRRAEMEGIRPVRTAHLGHTDVEMLIARHQETGVQLHAERRAGATHHERLPWPLRLVPPVVALLDLVVLHRFCADLFNVRPSDLGPDGLAAIALAVLGSGVAFTWLAMTGIRLRAFRRDLGQIAVRVMDPFTHALVGVGVVLAATMGVLMFERVSDRALSAAAYLSGGQAMVLALAFAILSFCGNLAVIAIHALDGSQLAAEHRALGHSLDRRARAIERHRRIASRRLRQADRVGALGRPDGSDPE